MPGWNFSLGGKKSTTKSNETIDATKIETGTQSGTSTTNQATTSTMTGSTQGTTASQGSSTTDQSGTTTQSGSGSQVSQQLSELFSGPVLGSLENTAMGLLSGVGKGAADGAIASGLAQQGEFDPTKFIEGGLASAQAQVQSGYDESLGGILDAIGGKNNSMVALLQNRLTGDANAQLAGVRSDLTGQAAQIVNQNLAAASQVKGQDSSLLTSVLDILKGGKASVSGNEQTQTAQTGTTTNTGTTTTAENSQNQQTQQQQQTELVNTLLTTLLTSLTNTQLNQTTNSKVSGTEISANGGYAA